MLSELVAFLVFMLQKLQQVLVDDGTTDKPVQAVAGIQDNAFEVLAESMPREIAWSGNVAPAPADERDVFLFGQSSPVATPSPLEGETVADEVTTLYDLIVRFLSFGESEAQLAEDQAGLDLASPLGGLSVNLIFEL